MVPLLPVNELIGTVGLVLLLAAFVMNAVGRIDADDPHYSALNAAGGTILAYYSYTLGSVPFLVLEVVWAGVAIHRLVRP